MSEEAIREDVSAELTAVEQEATPEAPETNEEKPRLSDPVSRREQRMAEVAEKAREERERDRKAAALMNDPDLTEEDYDARKAAEQSPPVEAPAGEEELAAPAGQGEAAKPQAAAEGEAPPANQNGWYTNEQGQRVKRLMVNGQPRELTEEQYDRFIQKDLAGDEKLQRASQIERQLGERARQLQEQERRLQQQLQPPPDTGADDEQLDKLFSEYHELLLDGDTDAAKAKMREIMKAGRPAPTPAVDPDAIARRVATQVKSEQAKEAHERNVNDAWGTFKRDYSDVVSDKGATAYADAQIELLRAENPDMPLKDLFLEAGRITRERLNLGGKPKPPEQEAGAAAAARAERLERKGKITPLPSATGARHQKQSKPELDTSPAAKIARMRASRALA